MRSYLGPIVMIALVVSVASARAAQTDSQRVAPWPPPRAMKPDVPGESFRGTWTSTKDSSATIQVTSYGGPMIRIVAAGRFEAVGYASSPTGVALATFPGPLASGDRPVRYGVLRFERRTDRTLRVRFADDLGGATTAEETWTLRNVGMVQSPKPAPAIPHLGEVLGPDDYPYVDQLPEPITKAFPTYPPAARAAGVQGEVMVQALVGRDGLVEDVKIVRSIPELDDAAAACIRRWRFKPATKQGEPVEVWVAIPVRFSLH